MKKSKKRDDPFFNIRKVGSANECTGLMPALPRNHEENQSEAALYAIHDDRAIAAFDLRDVARALRLPEQCAR